MSNNTEEGLSGNLSPYQHMDPEKHMIGESLPVPSAASAGIIAGTGSVGVSPIAAREDHVHPPSPILAAFMAAAGLYQEYTTAIGGAGWAVGNGSLNGRYTLINKMCHFRMQFIAGSTSTYGGSQLTILPPFPASGYRQFIDGWVIGATVNRILGMNVGASVFSMYSHNSATGGLGSLVQNAPITWVAGNSLSVSGVYEIA